MKEENSKSEFEFGSLCAVTLLGILEYPGHTPAPESLIKLVQDTSCEDSVDVVWKASTASSLECEKQCGIETGPTHHN